MDNQPDYKWTVFYKNPATDQLSREHFVNKTGRDGAIERVNVLLRKGYKAWLRAYRPPPRRYVDIVAERGSNG